MSRPYNYKASIAYRRYGSPMDTWAILGQREHDYLALVMMKQTLPLTVYLSLLIHTMCISCSCYKSAATHLLPLLGFTNRSYYTISYTPSVQFSLIIVAFHDCAYNHQSLSTFMDTAKNSPRFISFSDNSVSPLQNSSLVSHGISPPILHMPSNVPSPILTLLNLTILGSNPNVVLTSSCVFELASYRITK